MGTLPDGEKPRKHMLTEDQKARKAKMQRLRRSVQPMTELQAEKARTRSSSWYERNKERALEARKRYREKNPEKVKESKRRANAAHPETRRRRDLGAMYGLTWSAYKEMLAAQGGRCAICLCKRKLHVDHDHDTGKVRALLCTGCNTGIGCLGESTARLRAAAKYLERHGAKPVEHEALPLFAEVVGGSHA